MSATSWDVIEQFLAALAAAGIELAPGQSINPDGKLHRVRIATDKAGQRTGWYRLHCQSASKFEQVSASNFEQF